MNKVIHMQYSFNLTLAVKAYTTNGLFIGMNGNWY